jgi:hypothetical protein
MQQPNVKGRGAVRAAKRDRSRPFLSITHLGGCCSPPMLQFYRSPVPNHDSGPSKMYPNRLVTALQIGSDRHDIEQCVLVSERSGCVRLVADEIR